MDAKQRNGANGRWREAFERCARRLKLTARQAEVVYARTFERKPLTDIAEDLSLSLSTVKIHDRKARDRMGARNVLELTQRLFELVAEEVRDAPSSSPS